MDLGRSANLSVTLILYLLSFLSNGFVSRMIKYLEMMTVGSHQPLFRLHHLATPLILKSKASIVILSHLSFLVL